MAVDHTVSVSLQFVSVRADLDVEITATIIDLLGNMPAKAQTYC